MLKGSENLRDALDASIEAQPHKTAIIFLEDGEQVSEQITYQELATRIKRVAALLQNKTQPNDRVLLLYAPSIDFIVSFFACLYANVIAVPLYPPITPQLAEKLNLIIQNCEPKCMLTSLNIADRLKWLKLAKILDKPILRTLLDKIVDSNLLELANKELIVTDNLSAKLDKQYKPNLIKSDQIAFLQYTSGTTYHPKGVMLSHHNLLSNLKMITQNFNLTQGDNIVSWLPPYHDMGLIGCILTPLCIQSTVHLIPPITFLKKPLVWLKTITQYKGTGTSAPNFAYELCLNKVKKEELNQLDLHSWRVGISGAEPIRASTLKRFTEYFGQCGFQYESFAPAYGLAESTLIVTGKPWNKLPEVYWIDKQALTQNQVKLTENNSNSQPIVSAGYNCDGVDIKIVDLETNTICPDDKIGEVWIKAHSVAKGYWNAPEETQKAFQNYLATGEGPFLRSGDLGFIYNQQLFITGRIKDLIIINGRNYYPSDIELSIESHITLIQSGRSAVFSIEKNNQETIVVIAELSTDQDKQNMANIIKQIHEIIMKEYGIPVYDIVIVPKKTIQKTTSGKTQRLKMRELYLNKQLRILFQLKSGE